ncbi:hypothetical protein LCGC14_1330850 [marine sediment metagenome]|uniref:Uncharacterized protein n=1 Tax=marine sediment metagenome TaxID=412755 RepID=A0A0F9KHD2_9ZZZZ
MKSVKPAMVCIVAMSSLLWILVHLVYLFLSDGIVMLYEPSKIVLVLEMVAISGGIAFAVLTLVEYQRR